MDLVQVVRDAVKRGWLVVPDPALQGKPVVKGEIIRFDPTRDPRKLAEEIAAITHDCETVYI